MKLCSHPRSSNGEVGESWGELETVGGTTLDEDWRLLQRIWSTWYIYIIYESFSDLGEIRVWLRADFQSGSRVLKKVF